MHCIILKQFTQLVQQHYHHTFRIFTNAKGTNGSYGHQEVFVKYLTTGNIFCRAHKHFAANNQIRQQIHTKLNHTAAFHANCSEKQHGADADFYQFLFHLVGEPIFRCSFF